MMLINHRINDQDDAMLFVMLETLRPYLYELATKYLDWIEGHGRSNNSRSLTLQACAPHLRR